jgi:BirA family biotin operon repressor/biotin-[acetyl-CoA-carboxylase] ligase
MFKTHYFKTLTSTNKKARKFSTGHVIVAERQTKGRGRHKRKWSSGKGGIWLSIVLKPKTKNPAELTFIAAIAVQKAIKKTCSLETKIKWPNDIIYKNKKLCGILTETVFKKELEKMIVGIGINANNTLPYSLKNKAASLKNILKKEVNQKRLINSLLTQFQQLYKQYNKKEFRPILKEWKSLCGIFGKNVKIITTKKTYHGKAVNVDNNCNLIIKLSNGSLKKIIEGDVLFQ